MSAVLSPPRPGVWPYKFTLAQYMRMAEQGFFAGQRVHLIRGELFAMPAMKEPHALGITLVADELRRVFGTGFYVRVQMPLYPGLESDPEPDVAVVVGNPRDLTVPPTTALLVVEVADTSVDHDTTTKLELYAVANFPEYWVLDLEHNRLLVFRDPVTLPVGGNTYRTRLTLGPADAVSPLAAPAATFRVRDLLP